MKTRPPVGGPLARHPRRRATPPEQHRDDCGGHRFGCLLTPRGTTCSRIPQRADPTSNRAADRRTCTPPWSQSWGTQAVRVRHADPAYGPAAGFVRRHRWLLEDATRLLSLVRPFGALKTVSYASRRGERLAERVPLIAGRPPKGRRALPAESAIGRRYCQPCVSMHVSGQRRR